MEWIVIANRAEANIFKNTDSGSLKLLESFENPLGRLKNKQLQKDKAGVGRTRLKDSSPHNLTGEKDPHEEAAIQFVKRLVSYLKNQGNENHELSFKIIAEPHLLGLIKGSFRKNKVLTRVSWMPKDLQNIPPSKWPRILSLKKIPANKDMKIPSMVKN